LLILFGDMARNCEYNDGICLWRADSVNLRQLQVIARLWAHQQPTLARADKYPQEV
jgi:hypothetical protein